MYRTASDIETHPFSLTISRRLALSREAVTGPPAFGREPIFHGAADFDLELIESRTLNGNIQELIYRPTLHV